MSIKLKTSGNLSHIESFLRSMRARKFLNNLDRYGELGVEMLKSATPVASGKTAESWAYEIVEENGKITIHWINTNVNDGVNIAVILQFGHGTGTGGYVVGRDYINPAMRAVFDKIAEDAWQEVVRA